MIAYEAGFKAPLLNGRLRVNGAAFYYDYTNKQVRARLLVPISACSKSWSTFPNPMSGAWRASCSQSRSTA